MSQPQDYSFERSILRAFLSCSQEERKDLRWQYLDFESEKLQDYLAKLDLGDKSKEIASKLSENLQLCLLRTDPLKLRVKGFEREFSRQNVAEIIGALGSQFFPSRQMAYRAAYEASREIAYFAYGAWNEMFMTDPLSHLRDWGKKKSSKQVADGMVFWDLREGFGVQKTALDFLSQDRYFQYELEKPEDLIDFQTQLRSSPFDGALVEKLSHSFNKRATIGIRDGIRWFLGSRHPWFSWQRARELMTEAFRVHGKENFNTSQIVYYSWDPSLSEDEIQDRLKANKKTITAFSQALSWRLAGIKEFQNLDYDTLSRWILDIHHDYPDFDLESEGALGAQTHISFISHSIQGKVNKNILGEDEKMRRNFKIQAHFNSFGLIKTLLPKLSLDAQIRFFEAVTAELNHYNAQGGISTDEGIREYDRIPCVLLVVQDAGAAKTKENEKLLDSFYLSEMTQLEHASYMRSYSEISEKLVVFFTLVLRHMLDTKHVPDLRPKDLLKDFLLLGLWGTRTEKIRIHLYVPNDSDIETSLASKLARSELKFIGMDQIETHVLSDARNEAKLARFVASQVLPLIEPSILRIVGTFTMAMEEFRTGNRAQNLDTFSLLHYGVDISREALRYGVKGSLQNIASLFEFGLDSSLDLLQTGLDKAETKIKEKKKKS